MTTNSNSLFSINIKPDVDKIEIFKGQSMLPNTNVTIDGTIELNVIQPIQIKCIKVSFKGVSTSVILHNEHLNPDKRKLSTAKDEINLLDWDSLDCFRYLIGKEPNHSFSDPTATKTLIKLNETVSNTPQELRVGITSFRFSITLPHVDQLPPSILLPFHHIQYTIQAQVKLASMSERFKVTCANLAQQLSTIPPLTQYDETGKFLYETALLTPRKIKNAYSHVIQLHSFNYPTSASLLSIPSIHYRGSRPNFLKYDITLPKFMSLRRRFCFTFAFCYQNPTASIKSIDYYLEQTETYPMYTGDFSKAFKQNIINLMLPRKRVFCYTSQDMSNYVDGTKREFSISTYLPHIAPSINLETLKITHKIRTIVKFKNNEKPMYLSFPIEVGTIPDDSLVTPIHVRQELDQWLFISEENDDIHHKLPSYLDVLSEGLPPSPFIEQRS